MSWFGNFIKRQLNYDVDPEKVLDIRTDKYETRPIIEREESLFLYGPRDADSSDYEIVMHKPCSQSLQDGFSIFRSTEKRVALDKFSILKDKLPQLCDLTVCNTNSIQKYCDILKDNPFWNICHLAVYFSLSSSLTSPAISRHVNTVDPASEISPLQLAIREGNLSIIKQLVLLKASLNHFDSESSSIYHYAARTTEEIILYLASQDQSKVGLNHRNLSGYTPLHIGCMDDKPSCVIALITVGADVNLPATSPFASSTYQIPRPVGILSESVSDVGKQLLRTEMKNGGTPLHWSLSRKMISVLVQQNCDINALNFDSKTALHVMVERKNLDCVVSLLAHDALVNLMDINGNTALHLAVKEKHLHIIQALIVFGADLNLHNNAGETPRHIAATFQNDIGRKIVYLLHAVGASRCPSALSSCTAECSPTGTQNGIPPPPPSAPSPRAVTDLLIKECLEMGCGDESKKGRRVLCLDGGGIRGLVLISILLHIEAVTGKPITHCFDWIAATSTGGILALALAVGKSLKECLCFYFKMKDEVFVGMRPYNSEPLENLLKEVLGTDTTMADINYPRLMITGCLGDRKPVDLHIFRNYDSPAELLSSHLLPPSNTPSFKPIPPYREQLLWEVARATGAAPSYFRAHDRFVDGGLISNNPTIDALTEIHELNLALRKNGRASEATEPSVIVSVGTGSVPLAEHDCLDLYWPSGIIGTAKLVTGGLSMLGILVDQATQSDGRVVERARAICSMLRIPYFRFSPQLSEDIAMDESRDDHLVNMLWETKADLYSQPLIVNRLATLLTN